MMMAHAARLSALILVLGVAQPGMASLIGVAGTLHDPTINYDVTGVIANDGAGSLGINAFTFGGSAGVPVLQTLALSVSIDPLSGSFAGAGTLTVGTGGSYLSATVTDLGFMGSGSDTVTMDLLLVADSGSLIGSVYEAGQVLGMTVDATVAGGLPGFDVAWSGSVKGTVGAVPEPSSALMAAVALAFVHLRSRRARR